MRTNRAFTLVELLVVIGIIAVLIGILLPTINRAREKANQTVTLSALRQIGISVLTYQQEYKNRYPTNLEPANTDGRAFHGLALLAAKYKLPPKLLVNGNTTDTPATTTDSNGWPVLAELDGAPITPTTPTTIDSSNIQRVVWHCSFAYDHEYKKNHSKISRVYLGDRADYYQGRSYSANWKGRGMCLLWTDQHGEFVKSKAVKEQSDPNIYHHNEYLNEAGVYPGEGGDEVWDGVSVSPYTADTHLRFFSEEEDDGLLPKD